MDTELTHLYYRNSDDQGPDRRQHSYNPGNSDNANGNDPRKKWTSQLRIFVIIIALLSLLAIVPLLLNGQGSNMNGQAAIERDDPFAGTTLATGPREYSEQTASIIDEEVHRIEKSAYDRAIALLTSHRETLNGIARALRLHETLDAKQLRVIIEDFSTVYTGQL